MQSARVPSMLAAAALAMGCLGGPKPDPEYFTLSPSAGSTAGAPLAARPELGLAIGPIELPRYLDRPELVTRSGSYRLLVWPERRWAGSLQTDILRVVGDDLGRLLGTARIAVYPNEPRFSLSYRVLLELLEFDAVVGRSVRLRARWTIASGADGRALAIAESSTEQAVASPAWEDLVAAESAALGVLTREIAERIRLLAR